MLHNEEKELQIRLAELQADIQINLTACFGIVALLFTVLIGLEQILFVLRPEQYSIAIYLLIIIPILAAVGMLTILYFLRRIQVVRKQIGELWKEYCW